jgi:flagellin-like protein
MELAGRKAVSDMIATVLLIAFTVAVAGIVSVWITGFTSDSTGQVSDETTRQLYCAYAGVSVSSLSYCGGYFSGVVTNTNMKDIGNITLQIIFDNSSSQTIKLNASTSAVFMSLTPRAIDSFNVSIGGSNYNVLHFYTNCTNVYDDAGRSDVTAC